MAFSRAWAAKDVDALTAMVAEDAVYGASVGPEPGLTFTGKRAVSEGFRHMLDHDEADVVTITQVSMADDLVFACWTFDRAEGPPIKGIDVVQFENGLITKKDGYRKCLG